MTGLYVSVSSLVFLFWGVLWSKAGIANTLVKISFIALGLWGLFAYLNSSEYTIVVR